MADTADQVIDTDQGGQPTDQPPVENTDELTEEQKQAAEEEAKRQIEEQELEEQKKIEEKPWFKERMARFTRQKYEHLDQIETFKKENQDLKSRLEKLEQKKEPEFKPTQPEPQWRDYLVKYDDPDEAQVEFTKAYTKWSIEQQTELSKQRKAQEDQQADQVKQQQTFQEKRNATVAAGNQKYPDWDNVVLSMPGAIMHYQLANAIMEIPNGHEVAYYLGKNLQEAEKISKLSPYAMAAELGKIEAKLSTYEKKPSTSHPTPKPLKGNAPVTTEIDPGKDTKKWIDARNRGEI